MPFTSEKQRRFMWANHPSIARRWAHKYGNSVVTGEKPKKKRKNLLHR